MEGDCLAQMCVMVVRRKKDLADNVRPMEDGRTIDVSSSVCGTVEWRIADLLGNSRGKLSMLVEMFSKMVEGTRKKVALK